MSSVQPTVLQFVYSGPRETVWFSEPQHGLHCDGGPSDRDHCQHQVWEVRISGTLQLLLGMIDYCFCQFVYFWNEKSVGSVWDLVRRYQVSDWEITNPGRQNKLVWTKLKSVSLFSRERNNELAGENLRWLEKVFQRTVGDHGEITLNDFKTIVQSKNVSLVRQSQWLSLGVTRDVLQPFFVERVFQIFDKDDSGSISFQEFIDAIHQFAGQTPEDKIKFLFKVYDIDGKGK